jgi:hypothetical protein
MCLVHDHQYPGSCLQLAPYPYTYPHSDCRSPRRTAPASDVSATTDPRRGSLLNSANIIRREGWRLYRVWRIALCQEPKSRALGSLAFCRSSKITDEPFRLDLAELGNLVLVSSLCCAYADYHAIGVTSSAAENRISAVEARSLGFRIPASCIHFTPWLSSAM